MPLVTISINRFPIQPEVSNLSNLNSLVYEELEKVLECLQLQLRGLKNVSIGTFCQ